MEKQKNKPTLRFSEFEGDWEKKVLGEVAKFSKGKGISKADILESGKNECIRYGELYTVYRETINDIKSRTNIDIKDLVLSEANDVIIPASGETQIDIATASCVLKNGVALGGDLNIIKTNNNGVFLSYLLNSAKKQDIASLAQGISVVHLYSTQLATLKISFPTLPEQTKIANFLSSVDEKLQALKKKKSLLEAYKKGMMQKLFSQQIRFKDENGEEFGEWEEKKLGEVGNCLIGLTYSPDNVVENGGVLVLRSSNIQDGKLAFENNVYVETKISDKNFVKENDILICVRNGSRSLIGKCAIIRKEDEKYAFGAFMAVYRSKYNPFLFHIFKTDMYLKQVNEHLGATINQITNKSLNSFSFAFPSEIEQTKIANFLSSIDEKIRKVDAQITKTEIWKKGLLQQLFC